MVHCDICLGVGSVNTPIIKYTNEQGWTECFRHKNLHDCLSHVRFLFESIERAFKRTE